MSFRDRQDAGRRLAAALLPYRDEKPIILALPRGGVPVAAEVARVLDAPLDLLIVRKIGLPQQPELAAGAVVDGDAPLTVRNEEVIRAAGLSDADFSRIEDVERAELRRRRERYLHGRSPASLNGRTVIVVDDGVATGATVRAALRALRKQQPARLILAVPVAPSDTIRQLESEADRIECLESHGLFDASGASTTTSVRCPMTRLSRRWTWRDLASTPGLLAGEGPRYSVPEPASRRRSAARPIGEGAFPAQAPLAGPTSARRP